MSEQQLSSEQAQAKRQAAIEYHRKWRKSNPEKAKSYHLKDRDARNKKARERYHTKWKHDPEYIANQRANHKNWRKDPLNRLRVNMSGRLNKALVTGRCTMDLVGCSLDDLRKHLEAQFTIGMTWDNYGDWHVDHVVPLCSADTEEKLYELCHYTNLQPLWAADNISKGGY